MMLMRVVCYLLLAAPITVAWHMSGVSLSQRSLRRQQKPLEFRLASSTSSASNDDAYYRGMDAYQILECPRSANAKEIKAAYRKQIAKWHPDKFVGDEKMKQEGGARMEKINRAYYCLSDEERRSRYDKYGEEGVGSSAASEDRIKQGGIGGFGGQEIDISDIFSSIFGGGAGGGMGGVDIGDLFASAGTGGSRGRGKNSVSNDGSDVQVKCEIDFKTSIFGGQELVKARVGEVCNTCKGTGFKTPNAKPKACRKCQGNGMTQDIRQTPFGSVSSTSPCGRCSGSGEESDDYCLVCKGTGVIIQTKEINVRIPAGIEAGNTLRIPSGGSCGPRLGKRGDLFVTVNVLRDSKFTRHNLEIHSEETIPYFQAILGTTIPVTTVDGQVPVAIPAGCQPGQRVRVKGRGAPRLGGDQRGDAVITIKVAIPNGTMLKPGELELIQNISKLHS